MKNRHLDQLLMCAVYVVCKLAEVNSTFTEIMRCYRLQPQAESQIYRSVFIKSANEEQNNMQNNEIEPPTASTQQEQPMTPSNMAGTSQNYGSDERGDLIKFYNTVYVPSVTDFAKAIVDRSNSINLTLSPLPKGKSTTNSPVRRVTNSVMTRTLSAPIQASAAPHFSYCFSRSPAKVLKFITRL